MRFSASPKFAALLLMTISCFLSACSTALPPAPPKFAKVYRRPKASIGYERASLGPRGGLRGMQEGMRYPSVEITAHPEVDRFIAQFRGTRRACFLESSGRREQYEPMIEATMTRLGLPTELGIIAFIESRYNPNARSSDGSTVGMWQLSAPTAANYGLKVNKKADERRDATKSTEAAARFLAGLYDSFGDWHLAIAAYNSGPMRVRKAVEEAGTRDVFDLCSIGMLSQTNCDFVARFIALTVLRDDWDLYDLNELAPVGSFAAAEGRKIR